MRELYEQITNRIEHIDFEQLWPGFRPFRFALYNDEQVYLDGAVFKRDNRFVGNTAINYNGETIAIWFLETNPDYDILTSKIVHEMFHAFQTVSGEKRWPNEISALDYRYRLENLSVKNKENTILASVYHFFNASEFNRFLSLRKFRKQSFPKEYDYETKVEVIEGMAEYVELKALRLLNQKLFKERMNALIEIVKDYHRLIPVRQACYDIGALILFVCEQNGVDITHQIGAAEETVSDLIIRKTEYKNEASELSRDIQTLIDDYNHKNERVLKDFLLQTGNHLTGNFKIAGFDPLNTVKLDNLIHCSRFVAYTACDDVQFLNRECVVRVNDEWDITDIFY